MDLKPNGSWVLYICGGKWQLPWLLFLKEKGHRILLVDPFETSVCVTYADDFISLDARDTEGILGAVKQKGYEIELVTSDQTDVATETVAVVAEKLGLASNPVQIVRLFANKFENRSFAKNNGLGHTPEFANVSNLAELEEFTGLCKGPWIIKPVDSQSSRGVFRIDAENRAGWAEMLNEAKGYSKNGNVIAEQFVTGTEFTVEGICIRGSHQILAISRKKHFRTGIASELRYSSGLEASLLRELQKFHNQFIEATGLQTAVTHSEYIINEETGEFWIIEMACRGGGSLIPSHIVPWVSGVDVYDVFYRSLMGENVRINQTENRQAILFFFEFPPGKVISINGVEEGKKIAGVLRTELEFEVGDTIRLASDDRGRQGYAIVLAESEKELDLRVSELKSAIKVKTAEHAHI